MQTGLKKLLTARFFLSFAVQMQAVVVGWQMYNLTHDPLALGLVGLAEAVPALALSLYAGYLIDRSNPISALRWVAFGSFFSASIAFQFSTHVNALFLASFITGASRAFFQPSVFAIVPKMVTRENLPKASAWMSSTMQISRVAGPAIGGLIFGWMGMKFSAIVVGCVLILTMLILALIRFQSPPSPINKLSQFPTFKEFFAGTSFVFSHPILLPALSLDMISVLFGGVTAILPIFAKDILLVGPQSLGILRAAPAIGATFASLVFTRIDLKGYAGRWLIGSVAGFGLCILAFAASRSFILSAVVLSLSGVCDSVSVIIRATAVQLSSPDHLRGRIAAVNSIFIGSSNELGQFESGVAAKLMGAIPSVYFGGFMCLATVFTVSVLSRPLRKLNLKSL